jgi:TolA-binding protein
MKRPACNRAWQAEAVEDGRLSGAERASFERHAASCAECASELRALARLRQGAEWLPASMLSPLEHRRQRQALLRRAGELSQRAPVRPRPRAFAWALSGALVAAACIALALGAWRSGSGASAALAAPTYRLDASPGASWQTIKAGASLRLRLGSGSFRLEVDKLKAMQRFVLELPDGELEVIGTRFGVRVEPEGTRRVEVTEGRVALRLRDAPPISLAAGEIWTAQREAARAAPPPSVPAAPPSVSAAPPSVPAAEATSSTPAASAPSERSRKGARRTALPETRRAVEPPSGDQAATAGTHDDDFARAMAAFGAGDYGQAERLFQDFERRHAGDARQEDSAFLRAVARARRGDAAGARATAREYLERYPKGLRAPEAARLMGEAGPSTW